MTLESEFSVLEAISMTKSFGRPMAEALERLNITSIIVDDVAHVLGLKATGRRSAIEATLYFKINPGNYQVSYCIQPLHDILPLEKNTKKFNLSGAAEAYSRKLLFGLFPCYLEGCGLNAPEREYFLQHKYKMALTDEKITKKINFCYDLASIIESYSSKLQQNY